MQQLLLDLLMFWQHSRLQLLLLLLLLLLLQRSFLGCHRVPSLQLPPQAPPSRGNRPIQEDKRRSKVRRTKS